MDRQRLNLEYNTDSAAANIADFFSDLYSTGRLDNLSERDRCKARHLLDKYNNACHELFKFVVENRSLSGVFDHLKKCVNGDLTRRDESPRAQTESLSTIL